MKITISISGLKQSRWHELGMRFLFGGLVTAIAGLIAKEFGPSIGGLFLAFPAIFPASATLIEKHEREKKEKHGLKGINRARTLVADDAAGAALGCLGLASFAACVWLLMPIYPVALVLVISGAAWAGVSVLAWWIWKRL
jgi:uncharacterized membrane protein YiaA